MKSKRKVYSGHYKNGRKYVQHPVIRLGGKYLRKNGFEIGDTLHVSIVHGIIFIAKA
jgi:hypothetical protein